jgi:alpha-beta hydrolase superfamily lysophospholipase
MTMPPIATVLVAGVVKGLIVTNSGGMELGRQTFEDDGHKVESHIVFAGHSFSVTLERAERRAIVREGSTTVTRDVPAGTVALENGDWQAYVVAAEQYPDASEPVPVKVLLPGRGAVVDGTIRVVAHPDKSRKVDVAIGPLKVEVDIGPDGAVTHAAVPAQNVIARAEKGPLTPPTLPKPRPLPAGVVEEPVAVTRDGVTLRGTLMRPAQAAGKLPLAVIVAGSGPTDRDGNNYMGLRTDTYRMLAETLAADGVASIRYDKRCIGASDKVPEATLTIGDFVGDAAAFVAQARHDARYSKVTVVGHSEGGLIALLMAPGPTPPDALVLVAAPGRPLWQIIDEQLTHLGTKTPQTSTILAALRDGKPVTSYPPELAALFRPSVEKFLRSELSVDPAALLAKTKLPTTIVQGETDTQVAVADARLLAAARKDAHLVVLPRVNHVLKEEARVERAQASYGDATRPLGPGVADAVRAGIAR